MYLFRNMMIVLASANIFLCTAMATSLTIKQITENVNLNGSIPGGLKFSPDGARVTFLRSSVADERVLDLWEYNVAEKISRLLVKATDITGGEEQLSEIERGRRERMRITNFGIVDFSWSKDGKKILFPLGGELYEYSLASQSTNRLTNNKTFESDSRFSPQGSYISYIENNNIHIVNVNSKVIQTMTSSSSPTVKNGVAEFIAMEEMDRDTGYWWSEDEKYIAYIQFDEKNIDERGRYEVIRDGFKVLKERYPRAGTSNVTVKLGIMEVASGQTKWINLGDNKDIYLPRVSWVPNSSGIFYQIQNREQNRLDLIYADAKTANKRTILIEHSKTWINLNHGLKLIKNGKEFLWQSERTGFNHLYHYKSDGKLINQLTDGDWVVNGPVKLANDEIYFSANADDYLERHLYKVPLISDKQLRPEKVSIRAGWHTINFPDEGNNYIDRFSSADQPTQVSIHNLSGERELWIEENKINSDHPYSAYLGQHIKPEFGKINNKNGDELHYRMYKPRNMEPSKKYPVIFALYGGPGSQLVRNVWGNLLHQVWAQDGYVVFTLDNRGTSNKGTKFAGAVYRHLGDVEVEDQVVGANYLKTLDFIDGDKIAVQGHSYGGYMVLMSMFKAADTFKVGVSGAPVTDWKLYDTHYTERFLGQTSSDESIYEKSSVFPYINGLKGKLLILHGLADDNVLFNHTSMLIDELQQRAIQFDFMAYPGQTHRLGADRMRQRHVYETQKRYLDDHLK